MKKKVLIAAIIVAVFLAVPYLKKEYFTKKKPLRIENKKLSESEDGGAVDA